MKASFIDMHCHVLYGIDDGPQDFETSKKLIDAFVKDGIGTIIATPHVSPGRRRFHEEQYIEALKNTNAYCKEKGYGLRIYPGAEIKYSDAAARLLSEDRVPTLNNTRYVLVEWSTDASYEDIVKGVREITNAGFTVVIAHIERYPSLWHHAKKVLEMKQSFDMRIQIDCEAVLDKGAFFMKRFLKALLERHAVDFVATDAHDRSERKPRMKEAYNYFAKEYGTSYANALTRENQFELFDEDEDEDDMD